MKNIPEMIPEELRKKIKKKKFPEWIAPMLATLTHDRFSDEAWLYERKLDGERCLVLKKGKKVELYSRNQKILNKRYPEIEAAFGRQKEDFVADGELVAFDGDKTSFSMLQQRMHSDNFNGNMKVYYYAFDMMHCNGYSLEALPLRERKKVLKKAVEFRDPLRYTSHINQVGEKYADDACKKGWEGVIAKDAEAPYAHSRSKKWLKFKCEKSQELIIGGYTAPKGSRKGFGALLVGFYDDGKLHYAGKVGAGFSDDLLEDMHQKMKKIETTKNPYTEKDIKEKNVHWLKPELVGQFQFTEWTKNNRLRHPSFLGLRDDKKAKEVTKEKPA